MAERIHDHEGNVGSPHPFVEEIDFNEIRQLEVCTYSSLQFIAKKSQPETVFLCLQLLSTNVFCF